MTMRRMEGDSLIVLKAIETTEFRGYHSRNIRCEVSILSDSKVWILKSAHLRFSPLKADLHIGRSGRAGKANST